MRLAEHVAHTTDVDAMLEAMSPAQFLEWCAKDQIEPIGHAGTHEILAQIACMIATWLGAKDVDPWSYKWWQERPKKQAEDSVEAAVMALEMIGARRV